jgi:hypothetical protein
LTLKETQLLELNRMIIERLKLMHKARQMVSLAQFNVGDLVAFDYHGQTHSGTILKLNQKTASILTDDNHRWKVSPQFLKKIIQV